MRSIEPECVLASACELGEGPVWRNERLWFVDIKGRRIHQFNPGTGIDAHWEAPSDPGFVAPTADGGWIAGLKTGLHSFDPANGAFTLIHAVEPPRLGNRLNDGHVDAQGRLWFGSMHDAEMEKSGALYRLDERGLHRMDSGYCITNGPATCMREDRLYHTDTLERLIHVFDLSPTGDIFGKRVFARIDSRRGYPDGPCVDAEGCLWTGLFGGWGVQRYAPDGRLLAFVPFPVANVTKITFGGPDLRTVYATTAWKGLSPQDRIEQPLAGGLFRFDVDVPGQPQHLIAHA